MSLLKEARDTCKAAIVEDGISSMRKEYRIDLERRLTAYINTTPPTSQQEPVALNIVRKWPDGFQERLQQVWLDVVSFTPNIKLYDLQRVLAEFDLVMVVYDGKAADTTPPTAALAARQMRDAAVKVCLAGVGEEPDNCNCWYEAQDECAKSIAQLPVPSPSSEDCGEVQWRDLTEDQILNCWDKTADWIGYANEVIAKFKEKQGETYKQTQRADRQ